MALGADARNVLTMITKEGMLLVGLGIGSGAILALFLSRFLAGLLYGVKSNDPITLAAVSILLLVAALAATLLPAWRATRVDPMVDRKSTRLNSSHLVISYAVFCLKKKKSI